MTNLIFLESPKETFELCYTCRTTKLPRSKHCPYRQRCIAGYDHHCIWTGNTIGAKNHFLFMTMIIDETITMLFLFFDYFISLLFMPENFGFEEISLRDTFVKLGEEMFYVYVGIIITVFFTVWTCKLLIQQLKGIFTNILTNERINLMRYPEFHRVINGKDTIVNPYNRKKWYQNFGDFVTGKRSRLLMSKYMLSYLKEDGYAENIPLCKKQLINQ